MVVVSMLFYIAGGAQNLIKLANEVKTTTVGARRRIFNEMRKLAQTNFIITHYYVRRKVFEIKYVFELEIPVPVFTETHLLMITNMFGDFASD